MTKEQLRQYQYIEREIKLLQADVCQVRDSLQSAQILSDMPKGGNNADRIADTIAKIVDIEAIIHYKIRQLIELRGEIEATIDGLPSDQRVLMRLRYIEGCSFEAIAVNLNYSWRHTHRLHGNALQKIMS